MFCIKFVLVHKNTTKNDKMLTIYGIPACNTMKKTFDYLNEKGIVFEFHDYKKKGICAEQLNFFIEQLGEEIVLNKQGSTYRQLTDSEKANLNVFNFLQEKTSAIKRPILVQNDRCFAGFKPEELDVWLTA
jgi:Spx/MgsR family transcriptional regulator